MHGKCFIASDTSLSVSDDVFGGADGCKNPCLPSGKVSIVEQAVTGPFFGTVTVVVAIKCSEVVFVILSCC